MSDLISIAADPIPAFDGALPADLRSAFVQAVAARPARTPSGGGERGRGTGTQLVLAVMENELRPCFTSPRATEPRRQAWFATSIRFS